MSMHRPRARSWRSSTFYMAREISKLSSTVSMAMANERFRRLHWLLRRDLAPFRHRAVSRVAVHLAVLHDHRETPRPDQDRLVQKRVAVDQQDVGEGAFLDHAEFALVPHQVATDRGRALQRLRRRIAEKLHEMADVAGVLADRRDGETIVAADDDAHAPLAHLFVGGDGEFEFARHSHSFDDILGQADDVALEYAIVHETESGSDDHLVLDRLEHV